MAHTAFDRLVIGIGEDHVGTLAAQFQRDALERFSGGFGLYGQFGAEAIWAAFIATAMTSCILSIGYYLHGGWKKAKAMPNMGGPLIQAAPE